MDLDHLLREMDRLHASDLFLKEGVSPIMRIYGDLIRGEGDPLTGDELREAVFAVLTPQQVKTFERDWELDFAHEVKGVARFRGNLMKQRSRLGCFFRLIPYKISTMEELNLPAPCYEFAERPRGLVLMTGPAGAGKSTTQAAMLNYINEKFPVHMVTVEDPIEFQHECKTALVNQRELGRDTHSFANALKFVLRQDPDVILVGEMRDLETIHLAITAAETGHLVFGTLHTPDAVQTIDRVIDVFPTHQQQQIRMQLAVNLVGIVAQILVKRADGQGRVAAFEILAAIPSIRNSIRERKNYQIHSIMQTATKQGMFTMDQYLATLVRNGSIESKTALEAAHAPEELERLLGPAATSEVPVHA